MERADVSPNLCIPGRAAVAEAVAELTDKALGSVADRVVVLRCHGTSAFARDEAEYAGHPDLRGGRAGVRRTQGLQERLPRPGRLRARLPVRRPAPGRDGHRRGGPREVHRLRDLRDGLPQGPVRALSAQPPHRAVVRGARQAAWCAPPAWWAARCAASASRSARPAPSPGTARPSSSTTRSAWPTAPRATRSAWTSARASSCIASASAPSRGGRARTAVGGVIPDRDRPPAPAPPRPLAPRRRPIRS